MLLRAAPGTLNVVPNRLVAVGVTPALSLGFAAAPLSASAGKPASIHTLEATAIDSNKISLDSLKGKPTIIVNVASR